jgi:putative heme-binding domain-containing protein
VVFSQTCAVCHRFRGEGNELGPDISDVRIKTPEMLLSDILDPNNAIEPQWEPYSVRMRDGRTVVGIIASESNEALVVRTIGGSETIPRATLATCEPLGTSLMPQGLEATLTDTRMADLLAYLRSAATSNAARAASSR